MKIIFAAGGTGGHVNPALASAAAVRAREPDCEILFIGTPNKIEADVVPKAGFAFTGLDVEGFSRGKSVKSILKNLIVFVKAFLAMGKAKRIIRDFSPDVVVGFGGYVSGPVLKAAQKLKIRTCIHEQNAYPGVTNKMLAKRADCVMLTSPEAEKYMTCKNKPVVTGLPVREAILRADPKAAKAKVSPDGRPVVFSFGGSLGAKALNEAMTQVIIDKKDHQLRFIHACGKTGAAMPDTLRNAGVEVGDGANVRVSEYIYDMETYLAAADVVICRAGASTLAELKSVGRASILIPYPYAAENHQYHNARELSDRGAAVLIEEKDLTVEALERELEQILTDPEKRAAMERAAKSLSIDDAETRIAELIIGK